MVLNNLYAQTAMQSVFGINMVALVDGQPKVLNLKQILAAFLSNYTVPIKFLIFSTYL